MTEPPSSKRRPPSQEHHDPPSNRFAQYARGQGGRRQPNKQQNTTKKASLRRGKLSLHIFCTYAFLKNQRMKKKKEEKTRTICVALNDCIAFLLAAGSGAERREVVGRFQDRITSVDGGRGGGGKATRPPLRLIPPPRTNQARRNRFACLNRFAGGVSSAGEVVGRFPSHHLPRPPSPGVLTRVESTYFRALVMSSSRRER